MHRLCSVVALTRGAGQLFWPAQVRSACLPAVSPLPPSPPPPAEAHRDLVRRCLRTIIDAGYRCGAQARTSGCTWGAHAGPSAAAARRRAPPTPPAPAPPPAPSPMSFFARDYASYFKLAELLSLVDLSLVGAPGAAGRRMWRGRAGAGRAGSTAPPRGRTPCSPASPPHPPVPADHQAGCAVQPVGRLHHQPGHREAPVGGWVMPRWRCALLPPPAPGCAAGGVPERTPSSAHAATGLHPLLQAQVPGGH